MHRFPTLRNPPPPFERAQELFARDNWRMFAIERRRSTLGKASPNENICVYIGPCLHRIFMLIDMDLLEFSQVKPASFSVINIR